ncbi:MAG: ABC transporter permease, partial [Caldilineaceae bacterium SB0675_bin_29]|nr:ABC transporter permease [Caldilineaceae bacterium SB0675_bin_29]
MTRYIIRRLLIAVPVLWGIITLTFIISEIMPGDYVDALVPPGLRLEMGLDEAQLQRLRESYGLDRPVIVRYAIWLRELLLHGNLGYSFVTGQPALQEMAQVLPATLQLSVVTILFSLVVGTSLGIISAIKQYSVLDHLLTLQAFVWISTPGFVFAIIALYMFSLKLPL